MVYHLVYFSVRSLAMLLAFILAGMEKTYLIPVGQMSSSYQLYKIRKGGRELSGEVGYF